MPSFEQKKIGGNLFFYLTEQVRLKKGYKKIQVYLGKSIPKNLTDYYRDLADKEIALASSTFKDTELIKIEELRIRWKYFTLNMTDQQLEKFWIKFAIQFIFESNAIEGSRLSEKEVSSIINRQYVKKSLQRKEIQEVINSIKVFNLLKKGDFRLNQRTIISLHTLLMKGLGVKTGYKKVEIIVNNKPTTAPGKIRESMANLLRWLHLEKRGGKHPLLVFANFHQRFEKIHPFEDGNGRTGRLLFNWMLFNASYPPILFRKKNRESYFNALDKADEGIITKWHRHVIQVYKSSARGFLRTD